MKKRKWIITICVFVFLLISSCGSKEIGKEEMAQACVGHSMDELIAQIGEPSKKEEASSCLEDGGKDILLLYEEDGFEVYVLQKPDGSQIVREIYKVG